MNFSPLVIFLTGIYIACELIANVTASKPVSFAGITVPAAVFIYALTFTLVDLINEKLGKQGARYVVYTAFIANILLAAYVQLAILLPASSFYKDQNAFSSVLGSTPRIVTASLIAYIIASLVDIEIFAWWKQKVGRYKWARVLISNAVSTFIDSVIFITIAFTGVYPIISLIKGQYIIKMGVAVISLPLIYILREKGLLNKKKKVSSPVQF